MTAIEKTEFILLMIIAVLFCFFTFYLLVKLKITKDTLNKRIKFLEKEVRYDYLTQTLSRRAFIEEVEIALANDPNGTLLIFDVNGFKTVNDTFGHLEGDNLIKRFSSRLLKAFDKNLVGRLGGDEFLVFISGECDKEFINSKLRTSGVTEFRDKPTKLTLTSCCGAAIAPKNGTNFESLYEKADKALYRSKKTTHKIVYCK
ncbi:MAG: GGDEF domain-containing protein [Clostridia bacterium]|nr:GGDEF domain-containing protein [Clostridia bacterium]